MTKARWMSPEVGSNAVLTSSKRAAWGRVVLKTAYVESGHESCGKRFERASGVWSEPMREDQATVLGDSSVQRRLLSYVYREREVVFSQGAVTLVGTFTVPQGIGPFPAVLLMGPSPNAQQEGLAEVQQALALLADHLTRQGIVVMRTERHPLQQERFLQSGVVHTLRQEALTALEILKEQPEVDPDCVGMLGMGFGGVMAPLTAIASSDVAFVVMMGVPAKGMPETWLQKAMGTVEPQPLKAETSHGMDLADALSQLRCPVLAIQGAHDTQLGGRENLRHTEEALLLAENDFDYSVRELPGLNHHFQALQRSTASEYTEETLSPVALCVVSQWMTAHTGMVI